MEHTPDVDLDLIRRYNQPGPRYTSYPTAPHFTEAYGPDAFAEDLSRKGPPLSLYILPVALLLLRLSYDGDPRPDRAVPVGPQARDQAREPASGPRSAGRADPLGRPPTHLTAEQIHSLGTYLHDHFRVADDAEISVEADPRTLTFVSVEATLSFSFQRVRMT